MEAIVGKVVLRAKMRKVVHIRDGGVISNLAIHLARTTTEREKKERGTRVSLEDKYAIQYLIDERAPPRAVVCKLLSLLRL